MRMSPRTALLFFVVVGALFCSVSVSAATSVTGSSADDAASDLEQSISSSFAASSDSIDDDEYDLAVARAVLFQLPESLQLEQIDDVSDVVEAAVLDRVRFLFTSVLASSQDANPASGLDTTLSEWIATAVELSHHDEQRVRLLAYLMVQYGLDMFISAVGNLGDLFHQLLGYAHPSMIKSMLISAAALLTPQALSVRHEHDETLLMAAFRLIPDQDEILSRLLTSTPKPCLSVSMGHALHYIDSGRCIRFFQSAILEQLAAVDYDMNEFLDELQIVDQGLRNRTEAAIRIRDLFFSDGFLHPYLYLFAADFDVTDLYPSLVSPDDFPALLCEIRQLDPGHSRFILDTIAVIKSGAITAADVLGQCSFPKEVPEMIEAVRTHLRIDGDEKVPESSSAIVRYLRGLFVEAMHNTNIQIDQIDHLDSAQRIIIFLLQKVVHGQDGGFSSAILNSDSVRFCSNALKICAFLGRMHHGSVRLMAIMTSLFTSNDILGVREIWPDLIGTLAWIMTNVPADHPAVDVFIRIAAALLNHPAMLKEIATFGQIPMSATHRLLDNFVDQLSPALLFRLYLVVDHTPEQMLLLRVADWSADVPRYGFQYLVSRHPDWFQAKAFVTASPQELETVQEDVCSICLCEYDSTDSEEQDAADDICRTRCGHFFHSECLMNWMQWGFCPLCRSHLYNTIEAVLYFAQSGGSA